MPLVPLSVRKVSSFQVYSKRENTNAKFKENIIKESFKSLSSKREDLNESKSPNESKKCFQRVFEWSSR